MSQRSLWSLMTKQIPHKCIDCKKYNKKKEICRMNSHDVPKSVYHISFKEAQEPDYCDYWEDKDARTI